MTIPKEARTLLDGKNFAVLCTVNPTGTPEMGIVWVKRDHDDVLFCTIYGHRKFQNMEMNPNVSVCVFDPSDPYNYVEIRGQVTLDDRGGALLANELSMRYTGKPLHLQDGEIGYVARITPTVVVV